MTRYRIDIDGQAYGGESDEVLEAKPGFSDGWHRKQLGRNGVRLGGAHHTISGFRNLRSHVLRILEHFPDASELVIRRVDDHEETCVCRDGG